MRAKIEYAYQVKNVNAVYFRYNFDNTLEAIQNNPIHVIEFLLDMLDNYTMEV